METKKAKFKVGDKVKVIEYGHLIHGLVEYFEKTKFPLVCASEDGKNGFFDMVPEAVGMTGVVVKVQEQQGVSPTYAIDGIPGKQAWYDERQLEHAI